MLLANKYFFFPGAGSYGSEFSKLNRQLRPHVQTIRYPGRFDPGFGVPAPSFSALVDRCISSIREQGCEVVSLFGHSFGAYVAYACAQELTRIGFTPELLIVSGANGPNVPFGAFPSNEEEAYCYFESVAPRETESGPGNDWTTASIDLGLKDLALLREFKINPSHCKLSCRVEVFAGELDPLVTDEGLDDWRSVSDGQVRVHKLPGGHSDSISFLNANDFEI